jgi:hypothetical protein
MPVNQQNVLGRLAEYLWNRQQNSLLNATLQKIKAQLAVTGSFRFGLNGVRPSTNKSIREYSSP